MSKQDVVESVSVEGAEADRFQADQVLTVAAGHFTHDTYSAFIAPLLPLIQERLTINYAFAGGLAIYAQLPSLLNPFIGYLADKVSLRYFIILAPAVTATLLCLMGFAPNYVSLSLLMVAAGFSIAAFHAPAPAMIGEVAGNRVGMGMSLFMAAGELGRTVGPLVAVAAVGQFGLEGIWRLAFVGWGVSAILYYRLRHVSARPATKLEASLQDVWAKIYRFFPVMAWLMVARSLLLGALTTYLPLFMSDVLQTNLWLAGAALTILEGAGVAGALTAGTLSDRIGRLRILLFQLTLSPLLLLLFWYTPNTLAIPLLLALGLIAISPTPILLALVQDNFPDNRALANGIYLALNFSLRAFGIWMMGLLADRYGLSTAYLWAGLTAFGSVPAVFALGRVRRKWRA